MKLVREGFVINKAYPVFFKDFFLLKHIEAQYLLILAVFVRFWSLKKQIDENLF